MAADVVRFQLINKSLGLQYSTSGRQRCDRIGQRGNATFSYTPNRIRGLGSHWHNITAQSIIIHTTGNQKGASFLTRPDPSLPPIIGVVVARIHKFKHEDMLDYIKKLAFTFPTWDDNLLTPGNSDLAVLVVLTRFTPKQDRQSLQAVERQLHITPCGDFKLADAHGDLQPYFAFHTKNHSGLVLVTFQAVQGGMGIVKKYNHSTAKFSPNYIYGTNWYAFGMMRLPIMDFLDVWFKLDLDIVFPKGPMVNLVSLLKYDSPMQGVFMFIQWLNDAPYQLIGIHEWEASVFARESEECFHEEKASNFRCKDEEKCWRKWVVNYAEFTGGTMDFWQSPEVMSLGTSFEHFENGMWKHRWGDQQFWIPTMAIFFTPQEFDRIAFNHNKLWKSQILRPK